MIIGVAGWILLATSNGVLSGQVNITHNLVLIFRDLKVDCGNSRRLQWGCPARHEMKALAFPSLTAQRCVDIFRRDMSIAPGSQAIHDPSDDIRQLESRRLVSFAFSLALQLRFCRSDLLS